MKTEKSNTLFTLTITALQIAVDDAEDANREEQMDDTQQQSGSSATKEQHRRVRSRIVSVSVYNMKRLFKSKNVKTMVLGDYVKKF